MSALTCRRAALADLDALVQLECEFPGDRLSRRSFRRLLRRASAEIWVCSAGAKVIGNAVVLYRGHGRSARLYSLIVDPAARGHGVASVLVATVETAALRRGCERLRLEVRCDNTAATGLYRKRGYRIAGRVSRFYEDGQDALRLERAPLQEALAPPTQRQKRVGAGSSGR